MFCKNCGAKMDDDAKVCINCGWKVDSEVSKTSKTKSVSGFQIPVIPIIVVIGIIIVGFVVKTIFFGESSLAKQSKKVKVVTEYGSDTLVDEMDTVTFGLYPQSDISGNEKEPIEWIVLEKNDEEMLLLSKYILDCKCYNVADIDITWELCTLRKWLNETFYNTAFSDTEKKNIIMSNVVNEGNSKHGISGGNATYDHIYILSQEECEKYFGKGIVGIKALTGNSKYSYEYNSNKRLATKGTNYAKKDLWIINENDWYDGNSDFWLRTPGVNYTSFCTADSRGGVDFAGPSVDSFRGVRPLIRVKY